LREIDEKYFLKQRSFLLSCSNRDELSDEDYQILIENGRTYRGKQQWPQFRSFKPGFYPWFLDGEEIRLFTLVIEQVIHVSRIAKNDSNVIKKLEGWELVREYDEKSDEWTNAQYVEQESLKAVNDDVPLLVNELELQELRKSLKKSTITFEFDCDYILSPIQDHPNERPYYPSLLLSVERINGLIVFNDMLKITNKNEELQKFFLEFIRRIGSIPELIWVKEEIAHCIKPVTKKLNINVNVVQSLPFLEEARKEMEMMSSH